jgi:hypothetical protein
LGHLLGALPGFSGAGFDLVSNLNPLVSDQGASLFARLGRHQKRDCGPDQTPDEEPGNEGTKITVIVGHYVLL